MGRREGDFVKVLVKYFKMPFDTLKFNKNQKVFLIYRTGDSAINVRGRHRGKGRYITSFVNYGNKSSYELMKNIIIKTIEVNKEFADRHGLWYEEIKCPAFENKIPIEIINNDFKQIDNKILFEKKK